MSPALSTEGRYALATMYFAAVRWVTGALPLALTALVVPVVLTVLGAYPEMDPALAGFADPVTFLLLAGFVLAAALQTHGVDRLVAHAITARVGTSPRFLISVGPTYAGVLGTTGEQAGVFLALAGAVAASYGFALPVATPPNAIAYGSGYVTRAHVLRAGLLLDAVVVLTATGVVSLLLRFVWPAVLV